MAPKDAFETAQQDRNKNWHAIEAFYMTQILQTDF
jgi:hypothetical protein